MFQKEQLRRVIDYLKSTNESLKNNSDIATAIGMKTRTYISDLLSGTKPINENVVERFKVYLNVNPEFLKGEEVEMFLEKSNKSNSSNYQQERLARKNHISNKPFMVPLVPVKAQAGYVRAIDQSRFIDTLEEYAMPPGVNPVGAIWRYWEVEGESMEPAFKSGDIILTSQVHQMDWENMRNFYLYVIVTDEKVLFKRIYAKNQLEWVLISENEENYPQQLLPVEYIKEVWVFRRHIVNHAPPTKIFEIKV